MKKKILSLTLVVCLLAIAVVGGTLAYFTDTTDTKENVFTVGNVNIELTEPSWEGGQGEADAPAVYPGEPLAKDPTVENTGVNPCFVRVSVEGLDCLAPASDITYRTDYVVGNLGENWVLHTDGYYYYTEVLAAGEITDALFDQIVIPTDLTNGDATSDDAVEGTQATTFQVDVTAYAVQAQGARPSFSAVQSMTVAEIAEWFATCGM